MNGAHGDVQAPPQESDQSTKKKRPNYNSSWRSGMGKIYEDNIFPMLRREKKRVVQSNRPRIGVYFVREELVSKTREEGRVACVSPGRSQHQGVL